MLPIYIDPEETKLMTSFENNDNHSKNQNNEDYWMPVSLFIYFLIYLFSSLTQSLTQSITH